MGRDSERRGLLRRLHEIATLGAYEAAVKRAEREEAMGHRWRAARARRECERLHRQLEALGVAIPPNAELTERISPFLRDPEGTEP